jgi:hypothetical protein
MRYAVLALVGVCLAGCDSDSNPAAPTPVNIAGTWTGSFTSPLPSQTITMQLAQTGQDVTGSYTLSPAGLSGQVEGTVTGATFLGTLTLTRTIASTVCMSRGVLEGPADTSTLRWTTGRLEFFGLNALGCSIVSVGREFTATIDVHRS